MDCTVHEERLKRQRRGCLTEEHAGAKFQGLRAAWEVTEKEPHKADKLSDCEYERE